MGIFFHNIGKALTISMEYNRAIAQVSKLRKAAQECQAMNTQIDAASREIGYGWKGEAAQAMLDKLTAWETENQSIANELNAIATQLEQAAESIKYADDAAAGSFR